MFSGKESTSIHPNLWATGEMLNSFAVLSVKNEGGSDRTTKIKTSLGDFEIPVPEKVLITLGWRNEKQGMKAAFNRQRGRDMLGLPQVQLENLVKKMLGVK